MLTERFEAVDSEHEASDDGDGVFKTEEDQMAKREIKTQYLTVSEYLSDPVRVVDLSKQGPVYVVDEEGKVRLSVSRGYEPEPVRREYRMRRDVTVKR